MPEGLGKVVETGVLGAVVTPVVGVAVGGPPGEPVERGTGWVVGVFGGVTVTVTGGEMVTVGCGAWLWQPTTDTATIAARPSARGPARWPRTGTSSEIDRC